MHMLLAVKTTVALQIILGSANWLRSRLGLMAELYTDLRGILQISWSGLPATTV